MTPEEAVQAANLVAELWPASPLDGTRKAFYANALTAIPTSTQAMQAINRLFITERFQPPPGAVIDLALGLDALADAEWRLILQAATETQSRSPVTIGLDPDGLRIVHRLSGGLVGLPLQDWHRLDRIRNQFIAEFVELRRTAQQKASNHELNS